MTVDRRGVPLDEAVYLHCDVDKMYFSVEAIESPELAADPRAVIIAVDPREDPRAVVTTCNGMRQERYASLSKAGLQRRLGRQLCPGVRR